MSELERIIGWQRQQLLRNDQATRDELVRRWIEVERVLYEDVVLLAERAAARGYTTVTDLRRDERYQRLLDQVRAEIRRYQGESTDVITDAQDWTAKAGLADAKRGIQTLYDGTFAQLPVEAVTMLTGLAGNNTPLGDLLMELDPRDDDRLSRWLINGVARGKNPHAIADEMGYALGADLQRVLTIARTESIRVYNYATQQQYKESGVVTGWQRRETKDRRCCPACLIMDGTVYPLDVTWFDHVNGRGTMVPVIGKAEPRQTAWEWFGTLPEGDQRDILGDHRYEAWANGYPARDMVRVMVDTVWGASLGVRPISEIPEDYWRLT